MIIFLLPIVFLGRLTSGNTEMLLFSRFSSSSSRHLANDLGMADNLLYLNPKRLMLARLPTTKGKCINLKNKCSPLLESSWGKDSSTKKSMLHMNEAELPIVSGRSKSSLCCKSRLVICVQFPISFGRCSNWLWATSNVISLHSSPAERCKIQVHLGIWQKFTAKATAQFP